jgi:hypothetical protein
MGNAAWGHGHHQGYLDALAEFGEKLSKVRVQGRVEGAVLVAGALVGAGVGVWGFRQVRDRMLAYRDGEVIVATTSPGAEEIPPVDGSTGDTPNLSG